MAHRSVTSQTDLKSTLPGLVDNGFDPVDVLFAALSELQDRGGHFSQFAAGFLDEQDFDSEEEAGEFVEPLVLFWNRLSELRERDAGAELESLWTEIRAWLSKKRIAAAERIGQALLIFLNNVFTTHLADFRSVSFLEFPDRLGDIMQAAERTFSAEEYETISTLLVFGLNNGETPEGKKMDAGEILGKAVRLGLVFSNENQRLNQMKDDLGARGRNAPCPCGSGKKYKKCCGA